MKVKWKRDEQEGEALLLADCEFDVLKKRLPNLAGFPMFYNERSDSVSVWPEPMEGVEIIVERT